MAKKKEPKYAKEAILASKVFEGYQKDFVSVILTEPYYTIAEAKKAVADYFSKKEN